MHHLGVFIELNVQYEILAKEQGSSVYMHCIDFVMIEEYIVKYIVKYDFCYFGDNNVGETYVPILSEQSKS
jgi:hypothetical protein